MSFESAIRLLAVAKSVKNRIPLSPQTWFVVFSITVAGLASYLSYRWQIAIHSSDLYLPLCSSHAWVFGLNPYLSCSYTYDFNGLPAAPYPFTTLIIFAPFSLLDHVLGASLIWGIANGLLVYGILKSRQYRLFLVFTSAVYWYAFSWQQFSVLMTAIILLPSLLPLAILKPQLGLPVILTNITWRRLAIIITFVLLSLAIYPTWPIDWFVNARNFDGVIPLALLPLGPLMLLSLLRWREKDAWFLFLMACVPQRSIYDQTALWLLSKSPRQMLVLSILSWAIFAYFMYFGPFGSEATMRIVLVFIYLPLLAMQLIPILVTRLKPPAPLQKITP